MIQVDLAHDQITPLLFVIEVAEGEVPSSDFEKHVCALIEAKLTLENAAHFEDHTILPDGHRLLDERD